MGLGRALSCRAGVLQGFALLPLPNLQVSIASLLCGSESADT